MENKLLQPILQAGLLDIGDSDERLANIEQAIGDVQSELTRDHSLLERYTLTALDPHIAQDEPTVIEVEDIIAKHWKALRAKFSERPITIVRAVILHALYNVGTADADVARIVYLAASNFFPYAKLGREKDIVLRLITDLGDLAEEGAISDWALEENEPNLNLPVLKMSGLQFGEAEVDETILKKKLKAAANTSPNGHQPANGHLEQWSTHFSESASEGIVKVITDAMASLGNSLSPASIETPINKFFTEFKKSLDQALSKSLKSLTAVEQRSKLLWWKETLYSASLKASYRTLETELQPIILASDLFELLPNTAPASVDYLLKDTLLLINMQSEEEVTFEKFLAALLIPDNKKLLRGHFEEISSDGRVSLIDFIKLAIYEKVDVATFKERTGIELDAVATYGNIAVMTLHGLYVRYLTT